MEHSVVRFREPVRDCSEGTVGTVVSDYGDAMLVEVSNETGKGARLVQVPVAKLELKR